MTKTTSATAPVAVEPASGTEYEHVCANYPMDGAAIRNVMDRVGDKWSLLVIVSLEGGPLRYGQLKRHVVGVSQRMLTLTLRNLERDGLVIRTVHPQIPPRVDYELTDLGRTLIPPVRGVVHWAIGNHPAIEQARIAYDEREAAATDH
jgi:DNA-binding HxlR family transcriptional regulator